MKQKLIRFLIGSSPKIIHL
ncbi:hypothetical protein Golob_024996 [Gossypium lobatum]|uniref:Uncharacterized protein n=1 Tax=Gossypium lobatum TaxID=34289 RepID=A0A7J8NED1_9ROSI|nr:hypothetical protein [Gossypium lobatum]